MQFVGELDHNKTGAFHPLLYILKTEWCVPVHMCAQCTPIFQRPNQVGNFLASGRAWFSGNINTNTPNLMSS